MVGVALVGGEIILDGAIVSQPRRPNEPPLTVEKSQTESMRILDIRKHPSKSVSRLVYSGPNSQIGKRTIDKIVEE